MIRRSSPSNRFSVGAQLKSKTWRIKVIAIKKKTATLRKVRNPDGSVLSSAQEADVIAAVTRIEGRAPDRRALRHAVAPARPPEWRRTRSQRRRQKGGRRIGGLELTR